MTITTTESRPSKKLSRIPRRRNVAGGSSSLVRASSLSPDRPIPLVIQPAVRGLELLEWVGAHRDFIEESVRRSGAILFRGFGRLAVEGFKESVRAISGELLPYSDQATPRSQVSGNVYSSTDFAAEHPIELHNESCYARRWPLNLFFYSIETAEEGGETPIADCRKILKRLEGEILDTFRRRGVMYVRNFDERLGIPWQRAFATTDREELEAFCRAGDIEVEWKGDRLRTRQVRPPDIVHPRTGARTWFNQIAAFHVSTLAPEVAESLRAEFAEDELPKNTLYGDGEPIEPEVLEKIREVVRCETVSFPWREGDLMMVDNLLAAHGRAPYKGSRKVVVGMSEPYDWNEVA